MKMDLSQGPSGKMMKSKLRCKISTEMRKQKLKKIYVRKKIYVNFNVAEVVYMFNTSLHLSPLFSRSSLIPLL